MIKGPMLMNAMVASVLILVMIGKFTRADNINHKETIQVKGVVKDVNGIPVFNAAVFIKGSTLGTVTNIKGYFELSNVPENSLMTVSHPDFEPVEMDVSKSEKNYDIVLKAKLGWVSKTIPEVKPKKASETNEPPGNRLMLEKWPRFPGGTKELVKFLAHHMQYPPEAFKAGVEGQASVSFFLDEKGNISSPVIVNGPGWGIDEEAVRLVQNMPQWTPARQNGKAVAVRYTIVIPFDLEVEKLPIHIREKQPDIFSRKSRLTVNKPTFKNGTEFKAFFEKSLNLSQKEPPKTELYRYNMITRPVIMPLPAIEMKYKK
ncbi:TonB family protein [Dyadobacter chenwenxiniae]|uniref:TonB family protein n=1 Tax=Dyadobacter chenwenxiniae TaxID=2906456 RepID=A0A9X1TFN8_9BACT|nr:TonB family protein [Dyadobacter chenwenxiniae]MCF0062875.1 TonB family protein [Dyadobacter chenwenxiniae]UON84950.1 TonB family protein [Dyadobacter chenwenxiniae]